MEDEKVNAEGENSRRALGAMVLGAVGLSLISTKPEVAKAQDAGILVPHLQTIGAHAASIYEQAKKYQESFNKYVDGANSAFKFIDRTHSLIDRIRNLDEIAEVQRQQLNNTLKARRTGDWTKFRIRKLDIDSMAIIQEIKFFNRSIKTESDRLEKLEMSLKNEEDRERFNGRKRVLSRVGKAGLAIQQGKLFYEASKQNTAERKKAFDLASALDPETAMKGAALDAVPELLEIMRQMLRQQTLTNEQLCTITEIIGLQKPMSANGDYLLTESDLKKATDLAAEGDFDWSPKPADGPSNPKGSK